VASTYFPSPLGWLMVHLGVPFASLQTGTNLGDFSPINDVTKIWPRPILVIHGIKDEIIPFELGQRLFDTATQPKERLWLPEGNHNDILNDESAARAVREFFDTASAVPVI
jgi:fermentation-respiration switch protein FrsA (DUF1100 family)